MLLVALIFIAKIDLTFGWQQFEQPIRLPADSNGDAEWELVVRHRLSMSTEHEHDEVSIHDFLPANMGWQERSKDQLRPCLEHKTPISVPLNRQGNWTMLRREWAELTEQKLPDLVQLHGRHQRLWAVNGQIPGPTLVARHNADVRLRLRNGLLLDSISIHLHGMLMQNRWFQDGVAPIQQCPLPVLSNLDLEFRAHPSGTHWYHEHFPSGHQSTGLLGALVVLPEEGIKEDRDFVAILQDWPLVPTMEQEAAWADGSAKWAIGRHGEFDQSGNDGGSGNGTERAGEKEDDGDDGVWAILVNQKGWHRRMDIVYRPDKIPWTRFPVGKDEQIRMRLIHGGYRHPLTVHFERHQMEVVAADGNELEPQKLDALVLYPGERFDVRLHSLHNPLRRIYWMVVGLAEQFLSTGSRTLANRPIYGLAELDYGDDGRPDEEEDGVGGEGQKVDFQLGKCLNGTQGCKLLGCPFQGGGNTGSLFTTNDGRKFQCISVHELQMAASDDVIGNEKRGTEEGNVEKHVIAIDPSGQTVDGFKFQMPDSNFGPFFLDGSAQATIHAHNCSSEDCVQTPCTCFVHKRFARGSDVQIAFLHAGNTSGAANKNNIVDSFRQSFSIHLHGHKFSVLKIGYPQIGLEGNLQRNEQQEKCDIERNEVDAAQGCIPLPAHEQQLGGRAVMKDTVLVPFGGYTLIRFRADNPGWWLVETQQNGRGSTRFAFAVGDEKEMPKQSKDTPADCGIFEPGVEVYAQFMPNQMEL